MASLAILSNPQMINGTSVLFPVVSNIDSDSNKPSDVAAYYRTNSVVSSLFLLIVKLICMGSHKLCYSIAHDSILPSLHGCTQQEHQCGDPIADY